VERRFAFPSVSAEEILPSADGGFQRVEGGFGSEANGLVFVGQDVGGFLSPVSEGFVDLAEQGALRFGVGSELTGKTLVFGDPFSDGFARPNLLPLVVAEVLGGTTPQAFIGRCLGPLFCLALTVVDAPASRCRPPAMARVRLRLDEGNDSESGRPEVLRGFALSVGQRFGSASTNSRVKSPPL
jgi:hypothetical protein